MSFWLGPTLYRRVINSRGFPGRVSPSTSESDILVFDRSVRLELVRPQLCPLATCCCPGDSKATSIVHGALDPLRGWGPPGGRPGRRKGFAPTRHRRARGSCVSTGLERVQGQVLVAVTSDQAYPACRTGASALETPRTPPRTSGRPRWDRLTDPFDRPMAAR